MSGFLSVSHTDESFSQPIDQRELLVSTAIETSIALANVGFLEEDFDNRWRKEFDACNKIADNVVKLRRDLAKMEIELQKRKKALLKLEEVFIEENHKAFASYKALERQIKIVQINGDDDDRKAIESIFYRSLNKQSDAPFVLPRESVCFSAAEMFHETFSILALSSNITVPDEAKLKIRGAISLSGDETADMRGHLKLTRVFKRTAKPDVFHFIMSNTQLVNTDSVVSVYGVALRNRLHGVDFHGQALNLICWFGPAISNGGGGVFPKCRGDTFTLQVVGTDYGPYKTIYSSNERTHMTPEIISTLNRIAQQFGIDKDAKFPSSSKIDVDVDWTNAFWRRRLPLEYIDSLTNEQCHNGCCVSVVPLAVRIKCGKSADGESLPNVFSILCCHEKTGQTFWLKFDVNNVNELLQHRSDMPDISACACGQSLCRAVENYDSLQPVDRLSSNSPLNQLRCSEPKNETLLNRYAILDNLKNCSNMDPAVVLAEGQLTGAVKPFVADMFPEVGYTVCVNSFRPRRSRASRLRTLRANEDDDGDIEEDEDDDDDDVEEEKSVEAEGQANQKQDALKRKTELSETTATKKRVTVCGLCGLANSNKSSHFNANHGKKNVLSKTELTNWYDSLRKEIGEQKAKELAKV